MYSVFLYILLSIQYSYGMEDQTITLLQDTSYQLWHSSKYLDQIFLPICHPKDEQLLNDRQHFSVLLDYAKQQRYCPKTTTALLQLGSYFLNFSTAFDKDLVFLIFNYAIQSTGFLPTHYNLTEKIFKSPKIFKLENCTVEIEKVESIKQCHYCCVEKHLSRDEIFQLNVKLDNKCNDVDIFSHISEMKKQCITYNNLPKNYPFQIKCNLNEKNSEYSLIISSPKYFCALPEQPWIDSLHYFSLYKFIKTGIPIYKNGVIKTIPWADLGINKTGFDLKKVHFSEILDRQYLIFKDIKYDDNYSKIKIF